MYITANPHIMMLAIIMICSTTKSQQFNIRQEGIFSREKRALWSVKCDSEIASWVLRECASEALEEFNEEQETLFVELSTTFS